MNRVARARPAAVSGPDVAQLRRLAEHAAWIGGEVARRAFRGSTRVRYKPDRSEVTEVDVAAQNAIERFLNQQRPNDPFLGEESAAKRPSRRSTAKAEADDAVWWVVDPLDGTRNFVRGIACFACSVAAMHRGAPIVGAIYDPLQETMFSAGAGLGATRNGKALARLGKTPRDRRLLIGVPSLREKASAALVQHAFSAHLVRNVGSAALHLAMVAEGGLDAAILNQCKLWDLAAGAVIVSEVGGRLAMIDGAMVFPIDLREYAQDNIPCIASSKSAWRRFSAE